MFLGASAMTAVVSVSLLAGSYEDWSAQKKLDYLWSSVELDTAGDKFMNPLQTLWNVGQSNYLWAMTNTHADWRESGYHKSTHGIGGHALAHFKWESNDYSGMFQQADHCIVRMANAAQPGTLAMTAYGPNMAVKCLRDGVESANLQFIWQIDGYAVLPEGKTKSCSYFEAPLSNHNPLRDNITMTLKDTFIGAFNKVDPHSMLLGVSQMATHGQDGSVVDSPRFPFALVLSPAPGLNDVRCEFNDYTSQLLNLEAAGLAGPGKTLYEVHAVRDPAPDGPDSSTVEHIGSLVLDSAFTKSTFGDTQLFFRHTFFQEELDLLTSVQPDRAAAWSTYIDAGDNYKREGASLYWPWLSVAQRDSTVV